jgi:phosphoglycolate phosphatase-like HAD superfamily hydrolase
MEAVLFAEQGLAATDALWSEAVAHVARRLGRVKALDAASLPAGRRDGLAALAAWGDGDVSTWQLELGRFFEEHIPIYVRPSPTLNAAVRRLHRAGVRLGCWSPGPRPCTDVVLHFLGLARRVERCRIDPSPDAPLRLAAELGVAPGATLAVSGDAEELRAARAGGLRTAAALWVPGADKRALLAALPTYLAAEPSDLVPLALEGRQPVTP